MPMIDCLSKYEDLPLPPSFETLCLCFYLIYPIRPVYEHWNEPEKIGEMLEERALPDLKQVAVPAEPINQTG